MKGVTFGNYHSFDDWGLILSEKDIKAPKPKTMEIDIEGSDGVLDYTEFFGDVKFNNRQLSFRFSKGNLSSSAFIHMYEAVHNAIHGRYLSVMIDDDTGYYRGRITVSEWKLNKNIGELVIDVDAEPWKYKSESSSMLVNLEGNNLINLDSATFGIYGAWTKTETGYSYVRGSTVGGSYAAFKVPLAGGKTYTFSSGITSTGVSGILYVYSDKVYGTMIALGIGEVTFTPEKSGFYYLTLIANQSTESAEFTNIMLNEGNTVIPYEAYQNVDEITVSAYVENSRMPSVPDIYSMDDVTITNGEETFVIKAGETLRKEEFELKEGSNQFNITGTGIVVFDWQEGGL